MHAVVPKPIAPHMQHGPAIVVVAPVHVGQQRHLLLTGLADVGFRGMELFSMEWCAGALSWALEGECGCGGVVYVAVEGARGPACMLWSASPLPFGGCVVGAGGAANRLPWTCSRGDPKRCMLPSRSPDAASTSGDTRVLFSTWNAPGTTEYFFTCTVR